MLALIIPILNSVLGGIIKPFVAAWTDYERTKLTTGEAGSSAEYGAFNLGQLVGLPGLASLLPLFAVWAAAGVAWWRISPVD